MAIKLIASDLDATLLDDQKTYNQALFHEVLAQLKKQGITFVVATGNHPDKVGQYFGPELNELDVIANNGAQIFIQQALKASYPINRNNFTAIAQALSPYLSQLKMGLVFASNHQAYMLADHAQLGQSFQLARQYFKKVVLVDDVSSIAQPIYKISFTLEQHSHEVYEALQSILKNQVHVTTSGYGSIDIVSRQVSKARGLATLGNYLKIAPDEMMAFGDGINDLEMLRYVGHPYAMENSDPAVLAHDFPTTVADNNHDGVLKTILAKLNH